MKLILVIEDDNFTRSNIEQLLRRSGYKVVLAAEGIMGLDLARDLMPDLIISDIMMPGIDGFELQKRLSDDSDTSHIPLIFLTALTDSSDIRRGIQAGAGGYITKPFKAKELLEIIKTHLKEKEIHLTDYSFKLPGSEEDVPQ